MELRGIRRKLAVVPLTVLLLLGAVACDQGRDSAEKHEIVGERTVEVLYEAPERSAEKSTETPYPCDTYYDPAAGSPRLRSWPRFVKWSTDGTQLVFSEGPEVYAVAADGTGLRQIVVPAPEREGRGGPLSYFDLSPDGARVLYSTCNYPPSKEVPSGSGRLGDYEFELETVDIDGTEARRLTTNAAYDNYAVWSPDGERIAFVTGGGAADRIVKRAAIFTMAADGGDRRLEGAQAAHQPPQWSPDGERIAYVGVGAAERRDIHVVVADGSPDRKRLTHSVSGPSWSPDGERIAFAKVDGTRVALYTIAADGMDEQRLTTIEGWQPAPREGEPDPARAWIRKVSWSPDGTKILVLVNENAYPGVDVIGADGSGLGLVTVDNPYPDSIEDATWSPDGTRIAMVGTFGSRPSYDPARSIAVLTMAADGTDVRVLVGRQVAGSVASKRPFDGNIVGLAAVRGNISAEVAACGDGVAVADPETNPGLVEDCEALLEVQNALAGPWGLGWTASSSMSEWEGVVVEGSPPRVQEVVLNSRALGGEIPPELSGLTELRGLAMAGNALMGEIPTELGELKNLEHLNLRQNYLSGRIPPELGGLTGLIGLSLADNNLRGEIPVELGKLRGLTGLSLEGNDLEGEIPVQLGGLVELGYLTLAGNDLEGEIPAELGKLTKLRELDLSRNELDGEVPVELGRLASLERLRLNYNRLTGDIPGELVELTNLKELQFAGNQFTGCMAAGLRDVGYSDLDGLELPDCE